MRLAGVEVGYVESLYNLRRVCVKSDLRLAKVVAQFKIDEVDDDEVDEALHEAHAGGRCS